MRHLLLFASSVLSISAATTLTVWPVDSLNKVFQDDQPGAKKAAEQAWLIPRNGHASVQFAFRASEAVDALDVSVKLGGGLQTRVRHVGFVPVKRNPPDSPQDELVRAAPASFPDPLLEAMPFAQPANQTGAAWITVYAPESAKPGVYKGEAVFRSGGKKLAKAAFQVQVAAAVVPRQTLKVTNWVGLSESNLQKNHYSGDYWQTLANIARVLADYRQNVVITPVLSLTQARLEGDKLTYDFSNLDRWVETLRKAGTAEWIEGGHLLDRANGYDSPLRVPAFVVENGQVKQADLEANDPRAEAHMNSFLPALYGHLKEKGWLSTYVQHVLDEAHGEEPPVYLRYVGLVRKNMPGILTIDAIDQTAGLLGDACDIWVPQLGRFDDAIETIREHVKKGGQAWYYTCLFPQKRYPNRFIDQPLLKTRLLHWLNYRWDFTGYLHWGGNSWVGDAFQNVEVAIPGNEGGLPAGDAFVYYPYPEKNTFQASIRLEAMREGIEDFELLRAMDPAKAQKLAQEAMPGLADYVRDVAAFRKLQGELLR